DIESLKADSQRGLDALLAKTATVVAVFLCNKKCAIKNLWSTQHASRKRPSERQYRRPPRRVGSAFADGRARRYWRWHHRAGAGGLVFRHRPQRGYQCG